MAVVVSNQETFKYWHGSKSNQIFATISILIYGLYVVLQPDEPARSDLVIMTINQSCP